MALEYGGVEVSDAKRLKAIEDENARLKRLPAESMFDVSMPRDLLAEASLRPTCGALP